jgi:hypothetical protein
LVLVSKRSEVARVQRLFLIQLRPGSGKLALEGVATPTASEVPEPPRCRPHLLHEADVSVPDVLGEILDFAGIESMHA